MVRFVESGDESDAQTGDGLAPVTSLFGDRAGRAYAKTAADVRRELDDRLPEGRAPSRADSQQDAGQPTSIPARAPGRHAPPDDAGANKTDGRDADPIDFDAAKARRSRADARASVQRGGSTVDSAEQSLLKKLRVRQLSVSEARTYLGRHELDSESVEAILDAFVERGYLDDARLAEQVVYTAVDRKGQGRQAIAQSLAKRGVPRDIADAALAELPDDDAERALDFARSKAGSMRGLERDVALRRLSGQLARRGYGGSAALSAARQALSELTQASGRVRFE